MWYLAKELNGILLTGDNKLRKIASDDSVQVHGILHVLEMLVDYNIVPARKMADKLVKLKEINSRLPKDACEKLIEKWKK